MRVLDLFSGIGGFSLGLERAGMQTIQFVEIDPYCQTVLKKHWPGVPIHGDIRTFHAAAGSADVICGGFPCQDVSVAGNRVGMAGERSGLWSEFARIIGEVRPGYAVIENVPGLLVWGLGDVLRDLAALRYDAEWHCIPASHIGAPHRRDRIWILAYPGRECDDGRSGGCGGPQESGSRDRAARSGADAVHVADAAGERPGETGELQPARPEDGSGGRGAPVADTASGRAPSGAGSNPSVCGSGLQTTDDPEWEDARQIDLRHDTEYRSVCEAVMADADSGRSLESLDAAERGAGVEQTQPAGHRGGPAVADTHGDGCDTGGDPQEGLLRAPRDAARASGEQRADSRSQLAPVADTERAQRGPLSEPRGAAGRELLPQGQEGAVRPGSGGAQVAHPDSRRRYWERLEEHGVEQGAFWALPDGCGARRSGNGQRWIAKTEELADTDIDAGRQRGAGDAGESPRGRDTGGGDESGAVADSDSTGLEGRLSDELRERAGEWALGPGSPSTWRGTAEWWWLAEPPVGRVVNGLPHRVDRLRALGNSLVPQLAELIGNHIMRQEDNP